VLAFIVAMSWQVQLLAPLVPSWLGDIIYPISKTDLDPLRLIHFLALAYVTIWVVRADARFLAWRISRPLIWCGQQSLYVFCAGIVLSFTGHFFLIEVNNSFAAQIGVSLAGILLMVALAYLLGWYRRADRAESGGRRAGARALPGE